MPDTHIFILRAGIAGLAAAQQTLFFAGEAFARPGELGTVHGAIASGWWAAAETIQVVGLRDFRPPKVKQDRNSQISET